MGRPPLPAGLCGAASVRSTPMVPRPTSLRSTRHFPGSPARPYIGGRENTQRQLAMAPQGTSHHHVRLLELRRFNDRMINRPRKPPPPVGARTPRPQPPELALAAGASPRPSLPCFTTPAASRCTTMPPTPRPSASSSAAYNSAASANVSSAHDTFFPSRRRRSITACTVPSKTTLHNATERAFSISHKLLCLLHEILHLLLFYDLPNHSFGACLDDRREGEA